MIGTIQRKMWPCVLLPLAPMTLTIGPPGRIRAAREQRRFALATIFRAEDGPALFGSGSVAGSQSVNQSEEGPP